MKKFIYVLLAGVSFASLSCKKSFLEVPPQGQLTTDQVLANEANIDQWVNRIYGTINWREFRIGQQWLSVREMGADDFVPGIGSGSMATDLKVFQDYAHTPSTELYVERYWFRSFQNINFCNQVIDVTPGFKDQAVAKKAEAQAKYFRAYYYFDLVNVFGKVPLRDHVPSPSEYDIPASTEDSIYGLIISDLKYAVDNLPTKAQWGTAGLGHVTKGTAQGLLAKAYLFRKDYTNAQKYAGDVMTGGEYSLEPDYRNIFSPTNPYSAENMMPGHFSYNPAIAFGRTWNPFIEYQGISGQFGNGWVYPSESLVNSYETGDSRRTATIFNSGEVVEGFKNNSSITIPNGYKYANKKVIWPYQYWKDGTFMQQELNQIFLRYADIILIYAEASNELGQTDKVLQALEQIRFRARGNKTFVEAGVLPLIIETDKAKLREIIWKERRIELAMEGHRWFDLIRYNNVVPGYTENLLKNTYGRTNFNYTKFSRYPIPQFVVSSSNGILTQNDAWK
jgi:hypothetical protein